MRQIGTMTRRTRQRRFLTLVRRGDVYWDCAYHPVYCTESEGDDVAGVSLFDASAPRSCSIKHCGVVRLSPAQAFYLLGMKDEVLQAEKDWRKTRSSSAYKKVWEKWMTDGVL